MGPSVDHILRVPGLFILSGFFTWSCLEGSSLGSLCQVGSILAFIEWVPHLLLSNVFLICLCPKVLRFLMRSMFLTCFCRVGSSAVDVE